MINLERQLIEEKNIGIKIKDQKNDLEKKARRVMEVMTENKRKQQIIQEKTKEISLLKEQVEVLKHKAGERDRIYEKNKELVTKNTQMTSNIQCKQRNIEDLQQKLQEMQKEKFALQNPKRPGNTQNQGSFIKSSPSNLKSVNELPKSALKQQNQKTTPITKVQPPPEPKKENLPDVDMDIFI